MAKLGFFRVSLPIVLVSLWFFVGCASHRGGSITYADSLAPFHARPRWTAREVALEGYRLLLVTANDPPGVLVTVLKVKEGVYTIEVRVSRYGPEGGFESVRQVIQRKGALTREQWAQLQNLLVKADFWPVAASTGKLGAHDPNEMIVDADHLYIEGFKGLRRGSAEAYAPHEGSSSEALGDWFIEAARPFFVEDLRRIREAESRAVNAEREAGGQAEPTAPSTR